MMYFLHSHMNESNFKYIYFFSFFKLFLYVYTFSNLTIHGKAHKMKSRNKKYVLCTLPKENTFSQN